VEFDIPVEYSTNLGVGEGFWYYFDRFMSSLV
jgi:hypothetical protein